MLDDIAREPRDRDRDLLAVYADPLLEAGDPHGELIAIACERAALPPRGSERALELEHRERALIEAQSTRLHAVFDRYHGYEWRLGFVDELRVSHAGDERFDLWPKLAADPVFRLLRRIVIDAVQMDGHGDMAPIFAELAALAPKFPRLTEIAVLEGLNLGNPWIDGPIDIHEIAPLVHAFPQLEVLELDGNHPRLGALALPRLRRLALHGLEVDQIRTIINAQLPALEELDLGFATQRITNVAATFGPLLHRELGERLVTLGFAPPPHAAHYVIAELPGSPLARRVKTLSLRRAWLDDACYESLLANAAQLRRLDALELTARKIPAPTQRRLASALGATLVLL